MYDYYRSKEDAEENDDTRNEYRRSFIGYKLYQLSRLILRFGYFVEELAWGWIVSTRKD